TLPTAASASAVTDQDLIAISVKPTGEVFWKNESTALGAGELTARVRPLFQENPELRIYINADRDASHGAVIDVLDRVRQAGGTKGPFGIKPGPKPEAAAAPAGAASQP